MRHVNLEFKTNRQRKPALHTPSYSSPAYLPASLLGNKLLLMSVVVCAVLAACCVFFMLKIRAGNAPKKQPTT